MPCLLSQESYNSLQAVFPVFFQFISLIAFVCTVFDDISHIHTKKISLHLILYMNVSTPVDLMLKFPLLLHLHIIVKSAISYLSSIIQ